MSDKIKLMKTCDACPEQYDAYLGDRYVGYLRLRHGVFTVENEVGSIIYHARPRGDGIFESDERDYYLRFAVDAIQKSLSGDTGLMFLPDAPNVEYEIG